MHRCYVSIQDNRATIHGLETGELSVVKRTRNTIVLKEKGHSSWTVRGMARSYQSAQYRVLEIQSIDGNDGRLYCQQVTVFPVKAPRSVAEVAEEDYGGTHRTLQG